MNATTIQQGTHVNFKGKSFVLLSMDMGGKCKIKKLNLPNKGKILKEIDISELSEITK